jgi:hypothetical protein
MLSVTGDYDPELARDADFFDLAYIQLRRRREVKPQGDE